MHREPTNGAEAPAAREAPFVIDVRFGDGLTSARQAASTTAAARWSAIVAGDLPAVVVNGETIDDVVIDAAGAVIDGRGAILGRAGPTQLRPGSFLPAAGIMSFDLDDLATMEADPSLVGVVVHDMRHVLGFGTIWDELGRRQGAGTADALFTGARAMRELAALTGAATAPGVSLANVGGPGTREAHWREAVFGNELMTGVIAEGPNPLSRLTIAAFEDMGYEVGYAAADPYALPNAADRLAVGPRIGDHGGRGVMLAPRYTVLPESALL